MGILKNSELFDMLLRFFVKVWQVENKNSSEIERTESFLKSVHKELNKIKIDDFEISNLSGYEIDDKAPRYIYKIKPTSQPLMDNSHYICVYCGDKFNTTISTIRFPRIQECTTAIHVQIPAGTTCSRDCTNQWVEAATNKFVEGIKAEEDAAASITNFMEENKYSN